MSSAVNLLLLKIQETLQAGMIDDIAEGDLTRAHLVKLGLLQTEKTTQFIQLGINSGDHDKPEEMDGVTSLYKLPNIGITFPTREIGGGQSWVRRGVVNLECYYIGKNMTEVVAFEKAHEVMARLQYTLEQTPITEIPRDSYGERPFGQVFCYASSFFESGGPPTSYIFRGKAYWICYTDKQ